MSDHTAAAHGVSADSSAARVQDRSTSCRGDPRMKRALLYKLKHPHAATLDALLAGGFEFPDLGREGMTSKTLRDSNNITLAQRKNQLSRRLRQENQKQEMQNVAQWQSINQNNSIARSVSTSSRTFLAGADSNSASTLAHVSSGKNFTSLHVPEDEGQNRIMKCTSSVISSGVQSSVGRIDGFPPAIAADVQGTCSEPSAHPWGETNVIAHARDGDGDGFDFDVEQLAAVLGINWN